MNSESDQVVSMRIEGFDPLKEIKESDSSIDNLLEDSRKRDVLNILRSYTGTFDVFSESIQNSLDAIEKKWRLKQETYTPKLWISIDVQQSKIRVVDNGIGMGLTEFLYCPRPNVSFKNRREYRGHKGVGATFLAYGFTYFELHSKQLSGKFAGALQNGRQWAEDISRKIPKPVFQEKQHNVSELESEDSGTSVEIIIGEHKDERPNLQWLNVNTAEQWAKILRLKTPLGGIYIDSAPFVPECHIQVISSDGVCSSLVDGSISYYWPHEFEVINKAQDIDDIKKELEKIQGDPQLKYTKLPSEFKRLDCIWQIWDRETILADGSPFNSGRDVLDEKKIELIHSHNVYVYGCFFKSRTLWETFQKEELKVRPNVKIISGGLQLASDYMAQGDLITIPLTTAAGYQNNAHIIVHFKDGNPDVGRKVFQPELKDLAEFLSKKAVSEFRKYKNLMSADTGASYTPSSRDLYEWKKQQEDYGNKNPLRIRHDGCDISIISKPQQEQDVIALFHELVAIKLIQALWFFSTASNERYDCLFKYRYDDYQRYSYAKENNSLGVNPDLAVSGESHPLVLEYKYSFDALSRDIQNESKDGRDIDFVVCWNTGPNFSEHFELQPLLVGDEGVTRSIYGATHRAFMHTQYMFDVLVLEEFLEFIKDPVSAEAYQRKKYC